MIFALLVVLTDGLVNVPPSHWQAVHFEVLRNGSTVHCSFEVVSGANRVQAMLLERSQSDRFNAGRPMRPVHVTGFERSARFRAYVAEAGDYVLLLDNRLEGRYAADVRVRIESTDPQSVTVRELPPDRRRAVVTLSILFFGAVLVFSARQYIKHAR
jgi:hypothetical protein